jgi:hypothetical protein
MPRFARQAVLRVMTAVRIGDRGESGVAQSRCSSLGDIGYIDQR